ncbi:hypothetical protein K1719_003748 [Acacia pycnantha]|nr:hypothetical protein K1719_003748 [Acacia pycnantha]
MGIEEVDKSPLLNCSVVHFQIDRPTTMVKQPVRMKAVVYALSPFQQKVMSGLWKDLPGKIKQKVSENWLNAFLFLSPLVGNYA